MRNFFFSDHVLAAVTWSKPNEVVAVWMNRVQNRMLITAHDHAIGTPVTVSKNKIANKKENNFWMTNISSY